MRHALEYAREMDRKDPLSRFRDEFIFPTNPQGEPCLYFTGNSLGLQPKAARKAVDDEMDVWASMAVEGHFKSLHPWMTYHESLSESMARIVGAHPIEVTLMNTLTVNLHLMMVSFYRPTRERYKILVEAGAFPSDQYAVASQARFHGFDPTDAIVELQPREGEATLRHEDVLDAIERKGDQIALILLGNVNYLTGQAFNMAAITEAGHRKGCRVGFDLAHGAGNLVLQLHDWDVDFAVWCTYKYLNSGPGAIAGCFVHERHAHSADLPRFEGWWGNHKATRFQMRPRFDPSPGAEGWQLSNNPILSLAPMRASLEIFDRAGMLEIRRKSELLTAYLEFLLDDHPDCEIITPSDPAQRGCQLSLRFKRGAKEKLERLIAAGAICDFREPDIIRAAPAPLYNSFEDVHRLARLLSDLDR